MKWRNILSIFLYDFKTKKPLILLGLCMIPAIYGAVNLWALSSVYNNTGNMPVAVVNEDTGTIFNGEDLRVGNLLVDNLKDNNDLKWEFVSREEADTGLVEDHYYAAFIIPADFSQKVVSVTTGTIQRPQIVYKINNKLSSFGTKVMAFAKSSLADKINSSFVSVVSKTIGENVSPVGEKVKGHEQEIVAMKYGIIALDENMDAVTGALGNAASSAQTLTSMARNTQLAVPVLEEMQSTLKQSALSRIASLQSSDGDDTIETMLDWADSQLARTETVADSITQAGSTNLSAQSLTTGLDSAIAAVESARTAVSSYASVRSGTDVDSALSDIQDLEDMLDKAQDGVTALQGQIADGSPAAQAAAGQLAQTVRREDALVTALSARLLGLNQIFPSQHLTQAIARLDELHTANTALLTKLDQISSGQPAQDLQDALNKANNGIDSLRTPLEAAASFLNTAKSQDSAAQSRLSEISGNLQNLETQLKNARNRVSAASNTASSAQSDGTALSDTVRGDLSATRTALAAIRKNYTTQGKTDMDRMRSSLTLLLQDAAGKNGSYTAQLERVSQTLSNLGDNGSQISQTAGDLSTSLLASRQTLHTLSTKLQSISDSDLYSLLAALEADTSASADRVSDPFTVDEETLYEIPDNASNMSPLYTVICLWLGAFMLASALRLKAEDEKALQKFNPVERHIGRMTTFSVISIAQAIVMSVMNFSVLHIYVSSKVLFLFLTILIAVVFNSIIFTLVELFGVMGKTICCVYMIFQISGSGGGLPIQLTPWIFRKLHRTIPFTYAVNGLREAIAGPSAVSVNLDVMALIAFGAGFLIFGLIGVKLFYARMQRYTKAFQKSGIGL